MNWHQADQLDKRISTRITKSSWPALRIFFKCITLMGEAKAWLVILLGLMFAESKGWIFIPSARSFFSSTIAAAVAWGLSTLLKHVVKRPRPFQGLPALRHLEISERNDSMPSSHAATSCAFAGALLMAGHPLAAWVCLWAALVAFSRLYLGVHYLSDLVVGIAIGIFCAWMKSYWLLSL